MDTWNWKACGHFSSHERARGQGFAQTAPQNRPSPTCCARRLAATVPSVQVEYQVWYENDDGFKHTFDVYFRLKIAALLYRVPLPPVIPGWKTFCQPRLFLLVVISNEAWNIWWTSVHGLKRASIRVGIEFGEPRLFQFISFGAVLKVKPVLRRSAFKYWTICYR